MESDQMTNYLIQHWQSVILVTTLVALFVYFKWNTPLNLPPGPFSLPIVGTLPFLGMDIREPLIELGRKYGDIFTVYFGQRRVIILNSYDAIKEAFVKLHHSMSGRPQDFFWVEHIMERKGVVSTQGHLWREQRRFAHSVLREMGVGSPLMENKIMEEFVKLRQVLEKKSPGPCDPLYIIQCAISNIIYSMLFGQRLEYEDPKFIKRINILNESFKILGSTATLVVFPALRYLPGDYFCYNRLMQIKKYVNDQNRENIHAAKEELAQVKDTGDVKNSRSFIEAYIKVMQEHEDKGTETTFTEDQLVALTGDLFGAASETMTSTLRWGLVHLLHHPDVQERVQQEIDDIIGPERLPKMSDRSKMPYTDAFIHEMQRMGDVIPLGVPHSTTEEVNIKGYTIPPGTTVMSHLYAVHRDPNLWSNPHQFDPTRFLDADGKLRRPETLIPFSMGKRVCLGESLARMELFLFFTSMLQWFTFSSPPNQALPPMIGKLSVAHMPEPFKVMIQRR